MGCTMVLRVSLLPAVCVLGMAATRHVSHPTVKITVFYESLCPDSKRFVTEQLYPAWGKFGKSLRVSLKPFGKAKVWQTESGWNFTCQHGPQECRGNKLQACVLDQVPDPEEYLPAINCLMEPEARPDCTQYLVSTSTARLSQCVGGEEGSLLLHSLAQDTLSLNPALTFVPWILFNDYCDYSCGITWRRSSPPPWLT